MQQFQDLPLTMKAALAGVVILLLVLVLIRQRRAEAGGGAKKAPKVKAEKPKRERGRGRERTAKAERPQKDRGRRGRRGAEEAPAMEPVASPPVLPAVPVAPAPAMVETAAQGWPTPGEMTTQEFDPSVLAAPAMEASHPQQDWQQPAPAEDAAWQTAPAQYAAEPEWSAQAPATPAADWSTDAAAQEWAAPAEQTFDPAVGWADDQAATASWEAPPDAAGWPEQSAEASWDQQDPAGWSAEQPAWEAPAPDDEAAWQQPAAPVEDAQHFAAPEQEWSSASWDEPAAAPQHEDEQWAAPSWDPAAEVAADEPASPDADLSWQSPQEASWDVDASTPEPVAENEPAWVSDAPAAEEAAPAADAEPAWDAPEVDDAPWSAVDEPDPVSWEPVDDPAPVAEPLPSDLEIAAAEFAPLGEVDVPASMDPTWSLPEVVQDAPVMQPQAVQPTAAPAPQGVPGLPSPVVIDLAHLVDGGSRVELHIEQDAEGRGLRLSFGTAADAPAGPTTPAADAAHAEPAADEIPSFEVADETPVIEPVVTESDLDATADDVITTEEPIAEPAIETPRLGPDVPFLMGDRRPANDAPEHPEWTVPATDDLGPDVMHAPLDVETVQVGQPANGAAAEQQDPAKILADIRARLAALDARRGGDDQPGA